MVRKLTWDDMMPTPDPVRAEYYDPAVCGRPEHRTMPTPAGAIVGNLMAIISRGADMQRDNEYMRDLILRIWKHDEWLWVCDVDEPGSEQEYYHLRLLTDAGMLEERGRWGGQFRMTDAGHGFCEVISEDKGWARVKQLGSAAAGRGFEVLIDVVREGSRAAVLKTVGLE